MLLKHVSPDYEFGGTWNSQSGAMRVWFPVTRISPELRSGLDAHEQGRKLVERLGLIMAEPALELMEFHEAPLATANDDPLIQEDELNGEGFSEGIVIFTGLYSGLYGCDRMKGAEFVLEDFYSDQMLAKTRL